MIKKTIRFSSYIFLIIALLMVIQSLFNPLALFNPLRRSPEFIRESMFELIPSGTHIDDAIVILEEASVENGWRDMEVRRYRGVNLENSRGLSREDAQLLIERMELDNDSNMAGEHFIYLVLGRFRHHISWIAVESRFIFDENYKLVEILVSRRWSLASQDVWERGFS